MIAPQRNPKMLKRLREMENEVSELNKRRKAMEDVMKRCYAPSSAGRKHMTDDLVKVGDGSRAIGVGPKGKGLILYEIVNETKNPADEKAHKVSALAKEGTYELVRRHYAFDADNKYPSPFAVVKTQVDVTTTLISAVNAEGVAFSLRLCARGIIRIDYDDEKIVVTNGTSFWLMNVKAKKAVALAMPDSYGRPFHANIVHVLDDEPEIVAFVDSVALMLTFCRIDTERSALVHLFTAQIPAADVDFKTLHGMFALRKFPNDVRTWSRRPFYMCFYTSAALVFVRVNETDGCVTLFKLVPSKNHPNVIKRVEMAAGENETIRVLYESRAAAFTLLPHARAQYKTFTECAVAPVFKNDEVMLMVRDRMLF